MRRQADLEEVAARFDAWRAAKGWSFRMQSRPWGAAIALHDPHSASAISRCIVSVR